MERNRTLGIYFLALSIFCLGGAITFAVVEFRGVSTTLSLLMKHIDRTTEKVDPLLNEVKELRALVPSILKEVEQTRKHIPEILKEVEQTRVHIPEILKEGRETRKSIPKILKTANNVAVTAKRMTNEVKLLRAMIPGIVEQVVLTREAIPGYLTRGEKIAFQVNEAGKNTGEGLVTGLITGIVTAPFKLLSSIGNSIFDLFGEDIKELNEEDQEMMKETIQNALNENKVKDSKSWKNPKTAYSGKITVKSITKTDCRTIQAEVYKKGEKFLEKEFTLCQNGKKQWISK